MTESAESAVVVEVPGDKSITHRALILGALAEGTTRIRGHLDAADTRSTAEGLKQLGVRIPDLAGGELEFDGAPAARWVAGRSPIDCGNSGTLARLLLGVLGGAGVEAVVTGDASLRSRPMKRVTEPLAAMGVRFEWLGSEDRLPVRVMGGNLRPIDYPLPVPSAQVKSALLLAGVTGRVFTLVTERVRSRDHTERMLRGAGVPIVEHATSEGWRVELRDPPTRVPGLDVSVPGDPSSAAFLLVPSLLRGDGPPLLVRNLGLNPLRTGLFRVLERMGARLRVDREAGGDEPGSAEPSGRLTVIPSALVGASVGTADIPAMVDEVPVLAVLAARARGTTRVRGAAELRVKESDRLLALASGLRAIGVEVREHPDGLDVVGTDRPLRGTVDALGDHRIAMAFGALGATPGCDIVVEGREVAEVSFRGFWEVLADVAGRLRAPEVDRARARGGPVGRGGGRREPFSGVVTIDGPAGSGKSTTARAVARRLGIRHLDSGSLYRAVTLALIDSGEDSERWADWSLDRLEGLGIDLEPTEDGFRVLRHGSPIPDRLLRTAEVTGLVSHASQLARVRDHLMGHQRGAAAHGGLVADGRDMGTVVFPGALVKVFLVADLRRRAERRLQEREGPGPEGSHRVESEMEQIERRDRSDAERSASPLRPAPDALKLDTTGLSFDEQVEWVLAAVARVSSSA